MKHKLFPIMNVKKTTIIIITILLLLLVGCQGTTQPAPSPQPQLADPTAVPVEVVQETDAAVLLETYHAEFNAGNIDGVTALVSDDFTMSIVYGSADDPVFQGKEALAELLGSTQEDNFHLTVNDLQVAGDQITFTFSGLGNGLRQLGVGPEVGTAEATIQDDLIESITYTVDPEWVAAADAAEAALQQEAMIALIENYHVAFNAGNVEAVSALVTEDVMMKIIYGSDDDPVFEGQAALGELMASVQQDNFQIEVSDIQTTGDTVTFAYSGSGDGIRELGVGPEVGTAEATIQDGFIQSLTYTVDPAWVAAADAAEAALAEATATPEPLPDVSLETLLGTWNQFDDEAGGENWFLFYEDGTYQGKHGPSPETGVLVTEGTFTLEGNVITFVDPTDCPEGESYESRFITSQRIRFDPIEPTCELLPVKPIWQKQMVES